MEESEKMQIASPNMKLKFKLGFLNNLYISLDEHTDIKNTFKLSKGLKRYYLSLGADENFDINKDVNYMFLSFALNKILSSVIEVKCFNNFENWHQNYNKDRKNKVGTLITSIIWDFNLEAFRIFKKFRLTSDKKLDKLASLIFSRMGEICYG